ncbi:hypothetical protein BGX24_010790 [Mortierella sp. AD032]|nr:hypothetical protein BGX24_010790 [Mortierella sp. AD032]
MLKGQSPPNQGRQGLRSVAKSYRYTAAPIDPASVSYVDIRTDPVSKQRFVLWEDILKVFKGALHVRDAAKVLPFSRDTGLQTVQPRRVAADPNVVLDVVVDASVTADGVATSVTTNARRNPAYGLEEVAMDNYRNIDNPAFLPAARGPQLHTSDRTTPSNAEPHYPSGTNRPRAPQEYTDVFIPTDPTEKYIHMMVGARLGDKDAQAAVGDMYRDGQVVPKDLQAARDWYSKAAEQGHAIAQRNLSSLPKQKEEAINVKGPKLGSLNDKPQDLFQRFFDDMNQGPKALGEGKSTPTGNGRLVTKVLSQALARNLDAAGRGDKDALTQLGNMYYGGQCVPQNLGKAHEFLEPRWSGAIPDAVLEAVMSGVVNDNRSSFAHEGTTGSTGRNTDACRDAGQGDSWITSIQPAPTSTSRYTPGHNPSYGLVEIAMTNY